MDHHSSTRPYDLPQYIGTTISTNAIINTSLECLLSHIHLREEMYLPTLIFIIAICHSE